MSVLGGTCFADFGNTVYCVDRDTYKLKNLILWVVIFEPGLDEIIKKILKQKRLYLQQT